MCGSVQDKRRWARGRKTRGCYLLAQPHGGGAQGKRDQGSRGSHRSCPTVDSEIAGTRIESSLLSAFLKALEFLPTEEKKKKKGEESPKHIYFLPQRRFDHLSALPYPKLKMSLPTPRPAPAKLTPGSAGLSH